MARIGTRNKSFILTILNMDITTSTTIIPHFKEVMVRTSMIILNSLIFKATGLSFKEVGFIMVEGVSGDALDLIREAGEILINSQ